ncbi:ISAs1 family transposase [Polaribacter batillariae]|uniref:ISAs1 family transposase n=1 Tax=Polaribacter batillariae TaxID=2808900 RepID=A0ABX7T060_9FLAO|nr:ISAs1 family transposase [Polaribacter batillariae]QTD39143.1 ISAs1 family transposase [Polaribacter batillariae]
MYIILIINILYILKMTNKLVSIFDKIDDPRRDLTKLHQLNDILLIGIISVICGADSWNEMELYAKEKEDFLRTFLELPNGIPSHDTFNRVFSAIDSKQFELCFIEWVKTLAQLTDKEVIAIDGKTIRGAKHKGKKSPIHMVSAFACENNLVLGQVKTDEKSNEITAIPKLLEILSIQNTIITIDAMGCQTAIAEKIVTKEADYILAVKGNQEQLLEDIEDEFKFAKNTEINIQHTLDHGRIETRTCSCITDFKFIAKNNHWANLNTLVRIESIREFKNSDRPIEKATRYYISSLKANSEVFQKAIRSHWAIENKLHWTLDVAFCEDASRKRTGNASQNFSILTKIALNILRKDSKNKIGIKSKRLKAAINNQYMLKILKL